MSTLNIFQYNSVRWQKHLAQTHIQNDFHIILYICTLYTYTHTHCHSYSSFMPITFLSNICMFTFWIIFSNHNVFCFINRTLSFHSMDDFMVNWPFNLFVLLSCDLFWNIFWMHEYVAPPCSFYRSIGTVDERE